MDINLELTQIISKLEKRKEFILAELQTSPEGFLSYNRSKKSYVLIHEIRKDGIRYRHKLSRDPMLAKALLRKQALEDENLSLTKNITMIKTLLNEIDVFSATSELIKIANKFPGIDQHFLNSIFEADVVSSWATETYEQSDYKPEEKKQVNSRGLKVRSKSEVLLTEKLYEYDQEFRYEQVMHIGNITLVPDLTIRRKDGKIFIWEHAGMTNKQSYLDWQIRKLQLYAKVGFFPWDNLIITYDNSDGIIDLRIVESEIRNKLI